MDGWAGRPEGRRRVPPQGREQGPRSPGRVPLPAQPPVGALLLGSGAGALVQKTGRGIGCGGRPLFPAIGWAASPFPNERIGEYGVIALEFVVGIHREGRGRGRDLREVPPPAQPWLRASGRSSVYAVPFQEAGRGRGCGGYPSPYHHGAPPPLQRLGRRTGALPAAGLRPSAGNPSPRHGSCRSTRPRQGSGSATLGRYLTCTPQF
jgi:hypothetical protein